MNATQAKREQWAASDLKLHACMRKHVPAALAHNGEEAFDDHLVGVQSVLRAWDAPERLTNAALFHSIYGTEGFQGWKLPLSHRAEIAELIGEDAERLAWIFCMVDRESVDATVLQPSRTPDGSPPSFKARIELGSFPIPLRSEQEWIDFLTISLADWLEQVEGAARKANPTVFWKQGEAWAYRRDGYAAIMELLSSRGCEPARRMYHEVYAREPQHTRHLVQPVTPPIGNAASEARSALASSLFGFSSGGASTPIEQDWAPRPREASA